MATDNTTDEKKTSPQYDSTAQPLTTRIDKLDVPTNAAKPQHLRTADETFTPQSNLDAFRKWIADGKRPETEEQRKKREQNERRAKFFSSLGDGIAAISNLITTTQYAPNQYTKDNSLTDKAQKRFDDLKKEREANQAAFYNAYIQAKQLDDERADKEREWQRRIGLDDYNRKLQEAEQEHKDKLFQLQLAIDAGRVNEQEAKARKAGIDADYAARINDAKIISYMRGRSGGSGSGKKSYEWYDADGNIHYSDTYEDARQNSINAGTWVEPEQTETSTKTNPRGRVKETRTTTKKGKGYSQKPQKDDEVIDWKPNANNNSTSDEEIIDYVPKK